MGEATTKQKAKAVCVFTLNVAQWIAPCVRAMRAPSLANKAFTNYFPGLAIDPARENKKSRRNNAQPKSTTEVRLQARQHAEAKAKAEANTEAKTEAKRQRKTKAKQAKTCKTKQQPQQKKRRAPTSRPKQKQKAKAEANPKAPGG